MNSIRYKINEFFILFIILPVVFALDFPIWIKAIIGILGFIYVIYVLLKIERNEFKIARIPIGKLFLRKWL